MLLFDSKTYIYPATQNKPICQINCNWESYNSTTKKAKCNFDISTTSTIITINIDNLFNKKKNEKFLWY